MTALELWTGIAVQVLIGGSIVVFLWFVRDLLRSGWVAPDPGEEEDDGEPE